MRAVDTLNEDRERLRLLSEGASICRRTGIFSMHILS